MRKNYRRLCGDISAVSIRLLALIKCTITIVGIIILDWIVLAQNGIRFTDLPPAPLIP